MSCKHQEVRVKVELLEPVRLLKGKWRHLPSVALYVYRRWSGLARVCTSCGMEFKHRTHWLFESATKAAQKAWLGLGDMSQ